MKSEKVSSDVLEKVSDLLVYKRFDECLETCLGCLDKIKGSLEIERNAVLSEGMCLVAIQAFAELNRWTEVLPFVTQLYNGIEDCPATVAQACVLLHAKMKDFPTCTAVTNIWLRNKNNFTHPEYHVLLEIYIGKVLIPLTKWSDIPAFIDSCPGLQEQLRDQYKKQVKQLERRKEQTELDKIHELDTEEQNTVDVKENSCSIDDKPDILKHTSAEDSTNQSKTKNSDIASSPSFTRYTQKVALLVKKFFPHVAWNIVKNVALLAVVLYLIFMRSNIDMLSTEGWMAIWAVLVRLWKSMFAPYHLVKPSP